MELYFMASGVKHKLDLLETHMQSLPFRLPYTTPEGEEESIGMFGILAPIQLYKFVFPKAYLDKVLNTLELPNEGAYLKQFDAQAFAMRKALKAKKIPQPNKEIVAFPFNRDDVAIKGIGIKEDREITNKYGCIQEGI